MDLLPDDLLKIFDAALSADYSSLRKIGNLVARQIESTSPDVAREIRAMLRRRGVPLQASGYMEQLPVDSKSRLPLLEESLWPSTPIFLCDEARSTVTQFLAGVRHSPQLVAEGLNSRLSLLLSGPPGTGKSLLAGHIAAQLDRKMYVVRLDSIISSLLGDTSKNVRMIFDFVPSRNAVLFIDELDAVAKLRNDRYELGELKRVVNTVIQGLDSLDDSAVVIAATNHPELLDRAIWRRFPYKLDLTLPNADVRKELWQYFLFGNREIDERAKALASIGDKLTGADIETIALAARRNSILSGTAIDTGAITWAVLSANEGQHILPPHGGLSADQKKQVAEKIITNKSASQSDISRLLNVTRQAISAYLKVQKHGDRTRQ